MDRWLVKYLLILSQAVEKKLYILKNVDITKKGRWSIKKKIEIKWINKRIKEYKISTFSLTSLSNAVPNH